MLPDTSLASPRRRGTLSCALLAFLFACGDRSGGTPGKEPGPAPSASDTAGAHAAPAPTALKEAAPAEISTFWAEKFAPVGSRLTGIHPVEGALLVSEQQRVGRVVDEGIEWVGSIPKGGGAFGENMISQVTGRWPDAVDVLYTTTNGRAPEPTYLALTGVGRPRVWGEGGSPAWVRGFARVGASVLVAVRELGPQLRLYTVRGPELVRSFLGPDRAGCTEAEVHRDEHWGAGPAIDPTAFEGTPGGYLVSVGTLCEKRGTAAEVMDAAGKSTIVDLSGKLKPSEYVTALFRGKGEELLLIGGKGTVLRFLDGKFEPGPSFEGSVSEAFVSPGGQPHVRDGQTIFRLDGDRWALIGRLPWPSSWNRMAVDEKGALWASSGWGSSGDVYRLRKGPDTAFQEGCATPFVYLYDVSSDNDAKFTFPTTRKALSTFPEVSSLSLVEVDEGRRRLGVVVASKAQGEAVMAHVKATMPKETPKLLCYAPRNPRKIEMKPAGK